MYTKTKTTTLDIEINGHTLEVQSNFFKDIVVFIWIDNTHSNSTTLSDEDAVEFARDLLTPYFTDGRSNVILTGSSVMAIRNDDETTWVTVKGAHLLLNKKQTLKFAAALANAAAV